MSSRTYRWWRAALVAGAVLVLAGCAYERQRAQRDSKLVAIRTELGAGFLERGQLALAQEEIQKALALNPDDSEANNVMALVQARLQRNRRAEHYFERAVSSNPGNAGAQNNFGIFLCQTGRTRRALKHFAKAIADPLNPSQQWANANAGSCLLHAHRPAQAAAYFRRAMSLQPGMPVALLGLARADWAQGKAVAAEANLRQYLRTGTPSPQSLLLGVEIEHALGHLDQQATYALKLMAHYPNSVQAKQLQQLTSEGAL
ncbi:MAG TPA: type IV pilus biogenesis/stability protein PilW [Acidiferrobacteraceae bacterium]|nr:type IV pilus biogenesis/stability protein PilW [Acidiferrobacteraceae bacterium]